MSSRQEVIVEKAKWEEVKLNEVCDLISRGITPSYIQEDGVVVINQKCIRDNRVNLDLSRLTNPIKRKIPEQKYLKSYDVLINSTGVGTLGRVAQIKEIKEKITVDSHVTIVRGNEKILPRYLGYNLFMQQANIENLGEGSTGQTELSRTRLGEAISIKLPPINEQKAIANVLNSLDEKIETNNQINKTLEEIAAAIFKHWFVDFEFPNENGEPYRSSGGEMVESELGMIPKFFELKTLEEIALINPTEKLSKGKESIYVEMANLPTHSARIKGYDKKEYKGGTKFRNGDILFARITPCLENGKTAIVDFLKDGEIGFGSTEYIILRPLVLNSYYLYLLSRNDEFRNNAIKNMNGTSGRQRVDSSAIKQYRVACPTDEILERFLKICKPMFEQIKYNDEVSNALSNTRDTLLPKLMSGEIRVPIEE
ncbi:restriction endonuclease subunit S [Bacillus atrophaeus]|uniref:restriction endonuclease subunit S n=1 Tax=Bacillus atrophaeus TaxID=1452 RepID=UPI00228174B1|nr:restriction endonuclease subunit S [Bacillus atrophaeus]MCY8807975.1 restriction endonuclease subunit S [Bacillus atrophaeus]